MNTNKYAALHWKLKKRRELMIKLERIIRELNIVEREIEKIHGKDQDTSIKVHEELYEPGTLVRA